MTHTTSHPLCVDLDGTLINTDMLFESLLHLIKQNPIYLLWVPFWLARGRSVLKAEIARRIVFDAESLPFHEDFLASLRQQKSDGRALYLVTASHQRIAQPIAEHLELFDGVIASDDDANLKGETKGRVLRERFPEGFAYAGNAASDLKVWREAKSAVLVNVPRAVSRQAREFTSVEREFPPGKSWLHHLPATLRIHQWVKNLLIFVPLLASHQLNQPLLLGQLVIAFFAFSLVASSAYVWNDLLDLEADRHHRSKRKRPFAAGNVPIPVGLAVSTAALVLAVGMSVVLLSPLFVVVLVGYYLLTMGYSLWLKRVVLVDVFSLALLFTVRVVAGVAAMDPQVLSHWLLSFSVFFFLCLAFVKRHSEMLALRLQQKREAKGRGYVADDLEILANLGVASGFVSVLVLALYINSAEVRMLYTTPDFLWLVCLLFLYWISRVWIIAHRGLMHDDPIVFAIRDRTSYLVLGVMTLIILLAKYGLPTL